MYGFTAIPAKNGDRTFWIVESNQLNGCIGQGDNLTDAINELKNNEVEWINVARTQNIAVPEVNMLDLGI